MQKGYSENKISLKRMIYMLLTVATCLIGTVFLCLRQEILLDEIFCLALVSFVFFMIFMISLVNERLDNQLSFEGTSYSHLLVITVISWIILIGMSFRIQFIAPVMLIAFLYGIVLEEMLAVIFSIYLVMVYCLSSGLGMYVLYAYILMVILGVLLVSYRKKHLGEKVISSYLVVILLLNFIIPLIFYYFTYYTIGLSDLLSSGICALISAMFCVFLLDRLILWHMSEKTALYDTILDEDYSLVQNIKLYSMAEYNHAVRASRLAAICAEDASCNVNVCKAAAFYYRLGKIEGEPEIDNAVKVANNLCFPREVITILSEYEGILRRPSTPESAICHMIDKVVTKLELFDDETMSSNWNQDMVIYQTLNELSSSGIYDDSGLSMNQFLKVRERLVQEDILA